MARIIVVGEGMLELSGSAGEWRLGYGGDTLNTAIHLSRLGNDVSFMTALGADRFSDHLRAEWAYEGIDTSLVATDADRLPGLYAITTDAGGERSFAYWRGESAARRLFALEATEALKDRLENADLLLFSLISLAILPTEGREALMELCQVFRGRGGSVAFDGNFRTRLWDGRESAARARDAAIALATIGLPTLEDEVELGAPDEAAAVAAHWRSQGCAEPVVKLGGRGCLVVGEIIAPPELLRPVDTSGAGDAFNAGYLNARLAGRSPPSSAIEGHRLAGWVLGRRGAIPARTADAPYESLIRP